MTQSPGPWMERTMAALDVMPTAVRTFTEDWSGRELLDRAGGAARFLTDAGVPTSPFPCLINPTAPSVALTLAGALTGRPTAPLGVRLAATELAPMVQRLESDVLVADRANADLAGEVAAMAGVRLAVFDEFAGAELDVVETTPDSVLLLLHTSGTTGQPKPVPVRDSAVFHRSHPYQWHLGLAPGEIYCATGAFHHTGGVGMFFVCFASETGVIPLPRFSADSWRALADLRPTCSLLVPTMIDLLLAEKALDAVQLRALHYGTAPIHPETLSQALEALPDTNFAQAYGQTEGGPITMLPHEDHLRALAGEPHILSSIGKAVRNVELRFDDVNEDGVGELVARAGQVFLPGPDGWLHTGDLGRIDDEGFVYLQGRMGDKIIRGGENVYPLEVERVLEEHPQVREAAVIGVEDRRWGQTLKAWVVAADPDDPPNLDDLAEYTRERLARFKVPADWAFTEALPRNAGGKLLRRLLS